MPAAPDSPGSPLRSVAVVGAGLAGAQTVAALRVQGFDGHMTVLGAEGIEPYDRPPLSKELLTRTEPAWLRDELGTDLTLADEVRLGEPATSLRTSPDGVHVRTVRGEVTADAVVLATGARAVRPVGWETAATLHTAADAAALRAALRPGSRLVVVGAGWIGAEVAGVAAAAGVDVTVVEAASGPLATALGPTVGGLTVPWYAAAGVRLLTGTTVTSVTADAVELADGERVPADVVLVAVGARPASSWLTGSLPLEPDGSVAVDARYRVIGAPSHAPVVAVGDLARRRSPRHGWVAGGHWDGALRGPAVAVRGLLEPEPAASAGQGLPTEAPGRDVARTSADDPARTAVEDPAPYVFSTQLGHELACYGQPGPADDIVLRGDPAVAFTALWFTPGTSELTAVFAVDRRRDVAAARRLFTGAALPHLDRTLAADAAVALRDAVAR